MRRGLRGNINLLIGVFACAVISVIALGQALVPGTWSAKVEPGTLKPGATANLLLTIKLDPGWHIYALNQPPPPKALRIVLQEGPIFAVAGEPQQPKPKKEFDPNFQIETLFYENSATFTLPIKVAVDAPAGPQKVIAKVSFQLCDAERCLPPKTRPVEADVQIAAGAATVAAATAPNASSAVASVIATPLPVGTATPKVAVSPGPSPSTSASVAISPSPAATIEAVGAAGAGGQTPGAAPPTSRTSGAPTANDLKNSGLLNYIWIAMGFGFLALLTPCVFPMIPITVSFFTKRENQTTGASVKQALVYCFGIIFTFTGLGLLLTLVAGPAGINRVAASPWMNLFLTTLFVVFALNLFGMFEIRVPSSWLSKIDEKSRGGSSMAATLFMGLTFTLTSFTCTAAFVGTVLVAATQGQWYWAAIGMFAFATAFALPFFLLALFPSWLRSLPKSGGWLNSVKVVMGFLELAAAFKFLSNVDLVWGWQSVTRNLVLAAWIAIAVVTAIYLLGKFQLAYDTPIERLGVMRVLSATLFLGIGFYLLPGLFGGQLGELDAFLPPDTNQGIVRSAGNGGKPEAHFAWLPSYDAAVEQAKLTNKPVFLNFTGVTCTNCRWMEKNMFTDDLVKKELDRFVLAELYTDRETPEDERNGELQETKFKTVALPLYVILDAEGNEVAQFGGLTRDKNEFLTFLQAGTNRNPQVASR